jgi:hypothetical protein
VAHGHVVNDGGAEDGDDGQNVRFWFLVSVETSRIRLRFQYRGSRFLQNGISQHKGWKNNLLKLSLKAAKMTSYYGPHMTHI